MAHRPIIPPRIQRTGSRRAAQFTTGVMSTSSEAAALHGACFLAESTTALILASGWKGAAAPRRPTPSRISYRLRRPTDPGSGRGIAGDAVGTTDHPAGAPLTPEPRASEPDGGKGCEDADAVPKVGLEGKDQAVRSRGDSEGHDALFALVE